MEAAVPASLNAPSRDLRRPTARPPVRLAGRAREDDGFSLIELLAVVLIIGVLAAIAIPSLLNETTSADAAAAKTQVGTLQTAMKTYAMEHSGSYEGVTLAKLQVIEPTLRDTTTAIAVEVVRPSATGFTIESRAVGSNEAYKLESESGALTRSCAPAGRGGCSAGGGW
jgi:prepilin-type N-terminal cleavage/methylation domain-containing protein